MDAPEGAGPVDGDDLARLRETPLLYILDQSLNVVFSPAGTAAVLAPLAAALRESAAALKAGRPHVRVFEDRIVRAEALAGVDGTESYAVLVERFSPGDVAAAAAARFDLSALEQRVLAAMLAGDDPHDVLAGESLAASSIRDAVASLEEKVNGAGQTRLIERLFDSE